MDNPLGSNSTIGIIGGGQLGRMLSVAASRLGFKTHIFEPQINCPAGDVSHFVTNADYDNKSALQEFAQSVDVVTYEFENIPSSALDLIDALSIIRPGINALNISQNRLREKDFIRSIGLSTAPYSIDLVNGYKDIGPNAILKTIELGYDGKGQYRVNSESDLSNALARSNSPMILEGFVDFDYEVSVIGARDSKGNMCFYDPGENIHKNGILHSTTIPSKMDKQQLASAVSITGTILEKLEYIGVIGVELFVTKQGLIVNEIAPRVHNSGHWTQNGCAVDQFEKHIRAIAGWPLGDTKRHSNIVMQNLIGNDVDKAFTFAGCPDISIHLYGKTEVKAGRKMGHINTCVA